ncbi:MAG: NYN domain-containing protein [Solirubrobacterales bacterium]
MQKRRCRVVAFIDAQNVRGDFRRAFFPEDAPPSAGWFHPMALGNLFASRGPDFEDWTLSGVRIYAGSPVATRDSYAAAAHDRQVEAWRSEGAEPRLRPLLYPSAWPAEKPRQKGVDVELAVDVVRMAIAGEYEIGVIASTDQDLLPAIETLVALRGAEATPRICVVRYGSLPKRLNYTDKQGRTLHAFHLTEADYEGVRDDTDYTAPAPRSPDPD